MDTQKLQSYIDDFYRDLGRLNLDKWNYADGCAAVAATQLYAATGDRKFRDYALAYADSFVASDGTIRTYRPEEYRLDDVLPGRALIFAYKETGEKRYMAAVEKLLKQLETQPRTASGNYWHKKIYPHQIWLDGLYMAQPFRMEAEALTGETSQYLDICEQFEHVRVLMRDEKTGLYYHGCDESRSIFWADPVTGCSKNFWLRAMGWYVMALADTVEAMDRHVYDYMRPMQDTLRDALRSMLHFADPETGLLYQVIDKPELRGNYLETSGSAMTAAAIFKACRMELILEEKYRPGAEKILSSLIDNRLVEKDGQLKLTDTCAVAGLGPDVGRRDGTVGYYLSEPVVDDDVKGAAALFMAYAQYLMLQKWEAGERWKI